MVWDPKPGPIPESVDDPQVEVVHSGHEYVVEIHDISQGLQLSTSGNHRE